MKSRGQKPDKNYKYSNERKSGTEIKIPRLKKKHMSISVLGVPEKYKQMQRVSK